MRDSARVDMTIDEESYAGIRTELDRVLRPYPTLIGTIAERSGPGGRWPEIIIRGPHQDLRKALEALGYDSEDLLT